MLLSLPASHVALRVVYFGQGMHGFAAQEGIEHTVEGHLFRALLKTRLIVDRDSSEYARCGRTDKDVSALGNVISLRLRSHLREGVGFAEPDEGSAAASAEAGGGAAREELDYPRMLNAVLPPEVRVSGWCAVPVDFSARFSCRERQYRYFFDSSGLDVGRLREACRHLEGEHDFRNFCKMDVENVKSFTRTVLSFVVCEPPIPDGLHYFQIRGTAFLWHQVRCMVAILFMVGAGQEEPSLLPILLDLKATPKKPQYNMAPAAPLVLAATVFDGVSFALSAAQCTQLQTHLRERWAAEMTAAAMSQHAIDSLSGLASGAAKKPKHVPIQRRAIEPTFEERLAKTRAKAKEKETR